MTSQMKVCQQHYPKRIANEMNIMRIQSFEMINTKVVKKVSNRNTIGNLLREGAILQLTNSMVGNSAEPLNETKDFHNIQY